MMAQESIFGKERECRGLVIALDFDGVLADFHRLFCLAAGFADGMEYHVDDIRDWEWVMGWGKERFWNFCEWAHRPENILCIPPLNRDSINLFFNLFLFLIKTRSDSKIIILTHQVDRDSSYAGILKWLDYHGWDKYVDDVIVTSSQEEKACFDFDFLVDDSPEVCKAVLDSNRKAILYNRPWNSNSNIKCERVNNLDEVFSVVERHLGRWMI